MTFTMITVLFLLAIAFAYPTSSLHTGGQLIVETIPGPSLRNNIFQIPTEQPIAVYLPPSYDRCDKRYPVLYFLTGFGDLIQFYTTSGMFQGFLLKEAMDRLIREGKVKEMVVVIPNGQTFVQGTFYANSSVLGNWEDFIVCDVVSYIDKNYRTIPEAASRGIAGHSMGGYGALNLAMHHPDVFGVTYGFCPGLFTPDGLKNHVMFAERRTIKRYLAKQREFERVGGTEAKVKFLSYLSYLSVAGDFNAIFTYAYGAAFSPNPNNAPFVDYPFREEGDKLVLDPKSWDNFENGFGNLEAKVRQYRENLLRLRSITIDYATKDEYPWISEGAMYFASLLESAGIPHRLLNVDGDHNGKIRERMETSILAHFSSTLEFQ